ncbi:acetyl esterase [Streptacidiphilus sp. MAP12-33]|uniref:alpha/beta hydrolase n=1 Tax=Streptacidiphilus sp. MAP12-33 TaxID=3156266 RepID=UPI0035120DAB
MSRGDDPLPPLARRLCDAMTAAFPDPARAPLSAAALRRAASAGVAPRERATRPSHPLLTVGPCADAPVPIRAYDPGGGSRGAGGRPLTMATGDAPDGTVPGSAPGRPLVVFLHGGGWVLTGLETHDRLCRELAARTGALVLAVDHRAAPEHRFPAAVDDATAALRWALAEAARLGCDARRVVVAGDSSGGNLAAAAAAALRGEPQRPAGLLLVYPVLDALLDGASAAAFATGFFHTTAHQRWYWQQYLGPDGDPLDPRASPGLAPDLSGLPPTLLVLADCDPLRDEGLRFARRVAAAGVPARVELFPGTFHGFLGCLGVLPSAEEAMATLAHWLGSRGVS